MINVNLSRRDFLRKTGQAALVLVSVGTLDTIFNGCATITFEEQAPVIYPPLDGQKIQPPHNGCYIGFSKWPQPTDIERFGKIAKIYVEQLQAALSKLTFPKDFVEMLYRYRGYPFIYKTMFHSHRYGGFENILNSKEFTKDIERYAKGAVSCGKPFFISTMREMNDNRPVPHYKEMRPWKGKSAKYCIKVWRYIWQIFEDTGANEYATWVWSTIPTASTGGKLPPSNLYYPGDQYVDWIGLSAYSWADKPTMNLSFSGAIKYTYRDMRIRHPDKPMMMCELGRTTNKNQHKWIRDAYEKIKSWPGMKAVIYWYDIRQDPARLTEESINELKKIFKDSYFIGAK